MTKKEWRLLYIIIVCILGLNLLFFVREILSPFAAALILAYLLSPLVDWLEKHQMKRKVAVAIVITGILGGVAVIFLLALPKFYLELTKLASVLPQTMKSIEDFLFGLRENFRSTGLPSKVTLVLDQHLSQGEAVVANALNNFLNDLPQRLSSFSLIILSPILAIYFLTDWKEIERFFLRLVPSSGRIQWQRILQDISHVLRSYVRGDITVAFIVGILTGIGVKLIGMDYAVLIGFICGITDLIPYFGPFIGAVPVILLGLIKSPVMAIKVAVVIVVIQQLEGNVISPKIVGDQVGLHPLWIVFSLLAGGELLGVLGMLLAVPIAGVIQVVLRHIYRYLVAPDL